MLLRRVSRLALGDATVRIDLLVLGAVGHSRALKIRAVKIRAAELQATEVCATEVRGHEVRAAQNGAAEIRA